MHPTYRVVETGEIGQLIPCPCHDPVILEFKDGVLDAFHLRELEPTTHPITHGRLSVPNGNRGRPKGIERGTIDKMLQVYAFLKTQSEPVYRQAIERAVGFDCTHPLMVQPSQPKLDTLEGLGVAE